MLPSAVEFIGLSALLLGSAIIAAAMMKRIRYSPILGFVLIGMAIGPFGLGVVQDIQLVNLLAEVGIVLIFFTVGLQLSIGRFKEAGGSSIIVGLLQQSLMFFLGYVVGYLVGWSTIESLFLGAILGVTSTTVSVRLLQEMGVLRTKMASTIMSISIIDDLVALFALTILANVATVGTLSFFDILIKIGETLAFFVFTLAMGLKIVPKIMTVVEGLDIEEAPLLTALSLGFALALFANVIGLSSAIGAFLAGMTIASARKSHVVVNRVLPLRDFFSTIFFLSVGMLVSVAALFDHLWVSIPIVIVAVVGKLVANYVGAYLVGHSREEASTIGILMVPRGEFSYVIAKQGVDLSATKEAIYPITVFVSFVSILVLPALMRFMPTILDQRTIIPVRLFMLTELVVQIVRNLMVDIQRAKVIQGLRMLIPKLMVNVAITAVILSIISLADQYIFALYLAFPTLQTVSYETFKLILSLAAIAYPVLSIFGGTKKIAEMLFDAAQARIVRAPILTGGMHYIHRIIRNIVLAVTLLLVSDFITPSISIITGLENVLSIMSLITLGVFIYFILDTIFVINRRLEKSLISSLLAPSDDDEGK